MMTVALPRERFEHRIVRVNGESPDKQQERLNLLGQQGWRVASFIPEGMRIGHYVLVRSLTNTVDMDRSYLKKYVRRGPIPFTVGPKPKLTSQNPLITFIHEAILAGKWRMRDLSEETRKRGKCRISESGLNYWMTEKCQPKVNILQEVLETLGFQLLIAPLPPDRR